MAVLKPRSRLVYFRVSEDEFRQFTQICEYRGARSISDLARDAIQSMMEPRRDGQVDQLAAHLAALETMVSNLNRTIQRLSMDLNKQINCDASPGAETPEIHGSVQYIEEA